MLGGSNRRGQAWRLVAYQSVHKWFHALLSSPWWYYPWRVLGEERGIYFIGVPPPLVNYGLGHGWSVHWRIFTIRSCPSCHVISGFWTPFLPSRWPRIDPLHLPRHSTAPWTLFQGTLSISHIFHNLVRLAFDVTLSSFCPVLVMSRYQFTGSERLCPSSWQCHSCRCRS
jgi:hypothetical protein